MQTDWADDQREGMTCVGTRVSTSALRELCLPQRRIGSQHALFPCPRRPNLHLERRLIPEMKRELETSQRVGLLGTVSEHLWQRDEGIYWKSAIGPRREVSGTLSQFTACFLCQGACADSTHMWLLSYVWPMSCTRQPWLHDAFAYTSC